MGAYLDNSNIIKELNESTTFTDVAEDSYEATRIKLEESAIRREDLKRKTDAFAVGLKESLVKESLGKIYYNSIDQITSRDNKALMESLLESYIKDNGASNIISEMKYKSVMLGEMANAIMSTYQKVMEAVDPDNEESLTIADDDKTEFFDKLNKIDDIEDVTNMIRMRVSNAEEEFATDNMQDKFDSKNIVSQTAERIDALKQDYNGEDEDLAKFSAEVEQEAALEVKRKLNKLNTRKKGVLEQMTLVIAESVMKDDNLKKSYTESVSGDLIVENVIESAKCMYGLLETLNTIKLEKVDEMYISNLLKDLI